MFCKICTADKTFLDVVTCKIKHLQNVLEPREVDGSKTFLQMFYFTSNHGVMDGTLLVFILRKSVNYC